MYNCAQLIHAKLTHYASRCDIQWSVGGKTQRDYELENIRLKRELEPDS